MPLHLGPHHLARPQRRARVLHCWHLLLLRRRPELLVGCRCCCCCLLLVQQLELVWAGQLVVLLLVQHVRQRDLSAAAGSSSTKMSK